MAETQGTRIVVVDDDGATRKLLKRQLEQAGYIVEALEDGRAAIQPACEMGTGIVIADWSMPEMDGLQLCRALQELHQMGALGNIYFILLTAHSTKDKVVQGLEAGADDYLTKPYHQGELLARVKVGERILGLQDELVKRNMEVQKAFGQMTMLANKLEQLANTDPLTRLANRRSLFERFEEVWEHMQRDQGSVSCLMLDVDHFKRVNDTYGHAAGDEVLKVVARVIRENARRPELCGRFGGEEFLLILPVMSRAEAIQLAETIRLGISAAPINVEGASIPVTISCGVAEFDETTDSPDALIQHADAMLYAAKEHGRNQTWVYERDGTGVAALDHSRTANPPDAAGRSTPVRSKPREDTVQSPHADPAHE